MEESVNGNFEGYWPLIWTNGSSLDTFFPNPGALSYITAMNDSGQAVGITLAEPPGSNTGTLFNNNGIFQSLGTRGTPFGINNMGWIVGAEDAANSSIAVLPFHGSPVIRRCFNPSLKELPPLFCGSRGVSTN